VSNFTQFDILCISAVKQYYVKYNNSSFTRHLFSFLSKFMEAKNLPRSSSVHGQILTLKRLAIKKIASSRDPHLKRIS